MMEIEKSQNKMTPEEIVKFKNLDWHEHYDDFSEGLSQCYCGAILVAEMTKCWKCGSEK